MLTRLPSVTVSIRIPLFFRRISPTKTFNDLIYRCSIGAPGESFRSSLLLVNRGRASGTSRNGPCLRIRAVSSFGAEPLFLSSTRAGSFGLGSRTNEPRVARNVNGEDRGETAGRVHSSGIPASRRPAKYVASNRARVSGTPHPE